MGNAFFGDVDKIMGHPNSPDFSSFIFLDFDPLSVPGVSQTCASVFDSSSTEREYSYIPTRLTALIDNALTDEIRKEDGKKIRNLDCVVESPGVLRCDWSNLYKRIIVECQVANLRGIVQGPWGGYYEGNCEELLGIPPSFLEDGILDPETEWCPAYYGGREGSPTLASIELTVAFNSWALEEAISTGGELMGFESLANSTLGLEDTYQKMIVDNVPYCTGFDSCTVDDFFTLINAQAKAYSAYMEETSEMYDRYDIDIVHAAQGEGGPQANPVCIDSMLKLKKKNGAFSSCAWAGKKANRCKKGAMKKHCPLTCNACEERFLCADSPKTFKVPGGTSSCELVAQDPEERCSGGVETVCRETCGLCD